MASRIYVGRLSSRASERDVEHFFRGYGRIRDIVLKNGFGFVVRYILIYPLCIQLLYFVTNRYQPFEFEHAYLKVVYNSMRVVLDVKCNS